MMRIRQERLRRAREQNIPMTAQCPRWLRLVGRRNARHYQVIPDRAATLRRIFDEALTFGGHVIAGRLRQDGIPPFGKNGHWTAANARAILRNRAVIGVFQPHTTVNGKRQADGDPITGYFPAVVDEAVFARVQDALRQRRNTRKRD